MQLSIPPGDSNVARVCRPVLHIVFLMPCAAGYAPVFNTFFQAQVQG